MGPQSLVNDSGDDNNYGKVLKISGVEIFASDGISDFHANFHHFHNFFVQNLASKISRRTLPNLGRYNILLSKVKSYFRLTGLMNLFEVSREIPRFRQI